MHIAIVCDNVAMMLDFIMWSACHYTIFLPIHVLYDTLVRNGFIVWIQVKYLLLYLFVF